MNRSERCGLLLGVCLSLAPRAAAAFPWSHDMFRGQAVQPLAVPPRNLPSGILPTHGGTPPMSRAAADGTLHNPLPPSAAHLAHGKFLFETDCMPCHGRQGTGDGPVAFQMIVPPPDLTFAQPAERSDGYLYATIRDGGVVMPAYDDAMSAEERWEVVLYLRQLQGRLPAP
jgi:mono/diheme cytochrome c family protein